MDSCQPTAYLDSFQCSPEGGKCSRAVFQSPVLSLVDATITMPVEPNEPKIMLQANSCKYVLYAAFLPCLWAHASLCE